MNSTNATRWKGTRRALDHILTIDTIAIDALLQEVLRDPARYRRLLKRRDHEAQSLLDLLQVRLDLPLHQSLKSHYVRALIKLSRASGLFPECMTLNGLKLAGRAAVAGGAFGDIWMGNLGGQQISVKILKVYQRSDKNKLLKEFTSEAVTWRQLKHQNVLPFYGVFRLEDDRLCLASPWMENGNIVRFLASAPETKCVPLMLDIAEGLKYLHTFSPCIIHADLKGVNILISQSHRACLADFGLATAKDTMSLALTSATTTRITGTLRWQAPELLDPDLDEHKCNNSIASDIYAYACVCYEMFSGQLPFHDIKNDYRVMAAVTKGVRPSRPSHDLGRIRGLDDTIWNIIECCWSQEPNDRLSTHQIVESLCLSHHFADDQRPFDEFDVSFLARTPHSHAGHPFASLVGLVDDGPVINVELDPSESTTPEEL
ncbi:hypothetical protein PILCRDRAFT_68714 [Piloderma croceum F 1598]|uniref:Protein kinase domain-containing protein n=1 Tax=Piloderma croceum (strain F 1598) TaxID=765440 RepID=A0A0C3G060_PILCF|nr:hypothetical protein PILCRDRAFT_68714 [Piloderma croceum F 1598]